MSVINIYMNEIASFTVQNYSFETNLTLAGTIQQTKNIKNNKGIVIGQSCTINILDNVSNEVLDTVTGIPYLQTSVVQTLYGAIQSSLILGIRH